MGEVEGTDVRGDTMVQEVLSVATEGRKKGKRGEKKFDTDRGRRTDLIVIGENIGENTGGIF